MDSITYSYGNETWGDLITYNSQYVTLHDSMGNPIEYISQSSGNAPIDDAYLVWKNGRELASINSKATNTPIASYKYDSSGLRTNKTIGTSDIARYLYDDNGNLISEQRSTYALTFYYDGNGVRTHFTHESEAGRHTYYYRYNLQGDVIALLDSTGTVVAEYNYTPYGEHIGTVTGIAADNPFRYRGYYYDNETGYYYLQSRYYNPYTCRFISSDAAEYLGVTGTVLGYSLFAYCENDPINFVDHSGTSSTGIILFIATTGAVISLVSIILNKIDYKINSAYTSSGYIDNQHELEKLKLGYIGADYNGCGWISVYNAMKMIGKQQSVADVIKFFDNWQNTILFGVFGVNPAAISNYFMEKEVECEWSFLGEGITEYWENMAKNSSACIVLYAHNQGAHYAALYWDGQQYVVYNDDYDDVSSLQDYMQDAGGALLKIWCIY